MDRYAGSGPNASAGASGASGFSRSHIERAKQQQHAGNTSIIAATWYARHLDRSDNSPTSS
jgi:hypothetical protein